MKQAAWKFRIQKLLQLTDILMKAMSNKNFYNSLNKWGIRDTYAQLINLSGNVGVTC